MAKGFPSAAELRAASTSEDVRALLVAAGVDGAAAALIETLAAELKSSTRARELLLASVAHDLRNPLNTFAMSSGLLRDDFEGSFDKARGLSLLGRMDRASSRMQSLIEDLLEASRVEARAFELAPKQESVAGVVRAAIAAAAPVVADKGAKIEEGAIDETHTHLLDRARVAQALAKLVAVALKTIGEGGVIQLGVEARDGAAAFTLLATPPRSTKSTAPPDESRRGLAYVIAHGLVTLQGGTIATESSATGPRLAVTFPKA